MDATTPAPPAAEQAPDGWQRKTALFLASQGLSLFGSMLVQYAIIWYITLTTQSGAILMLSTLAGFLPQIVISLFAGVWADRYPRKFLIIGADLLTAASTLALALCFFLGYRELWVILLVSAIRSVGGGIQMPAVNALLPQIVPQDRLMRVNSINGTVQPFVMLAAPILAGALLSFSRIEQIFFIDVTTALLAVGLLIALKAPRQPRSAAGSLGYLADLRAGLSFVGRTPAIRTLFVFFASVFFLITPVAFLSPLLVTRSFGNEVWRLTANEITFFGGSIVGGVIMTLWGGFPNRFRTIGLACVLWALLFAALGLASNFVLYLVIMTLAGLPMPFWGASTTTLLQELVPGEMQGRVFGVQQLIMNAVMPAGMLVFGPLADRVSIELMLVVTGVAMALPGIWLFFHRSGHPAPAAGHRPAPDMELADCVEC